ncbi:BppU family phage baseplate upper protein [Peribacillus frigoritolerans]
MGKWVHPVDLTGTIVRLAIKKPDRNTVFQNGVIMDAVNGKCD